MRRAGFIGTRWLGVGLASVLAVVTLSLAISGRLGLYINPESSWFAVGMSIFVLAGAVASFTLPLGAEDDHGHDHGHAAPALGLESSPAAGPLTRTSARRKEDSDGILLGSRESPSLAEARRTGAAPPGPPAHDHPHPRRSPLAVAATVTGGVVASGVVLLTLALPPASLSADLAMSRDTGAPPLFGGTDVVVLASTGDTSSFGIGEWAAVFATATNPEAFDGETVTLTGFVTPGTDFDLTRLVITHCVIDAQPASVPITTDVDVPETGQWVTVTGTVRSTSDGRLQIDATSVEEIAEPEDPYEY